VGRPGVHFMKQLRRKLMGQNIAKITKCFSGSFLLQKYPRIFLHKVDSFRQFLDGVYSIIPEKNRPKRLQSKWK
jgi:hypothetical protein